MTGKARNELISELIFIDREELIVFRRSKKMIVKKKPLIAAVTAVVVFVGVFAGYRWYQGKKTSAPVNAAEAVDMVTRGNIEVSITGEASVEPYERYEIISMVSGDIISSPYDVGDTVEEGDVLYQFDTESAQLSIEKQEISLEQSRTNLEEAQSDLADAKSKLNITAPNSGIISGLTIKEGTSVSNNETIAQIDNTSQMEVTVPFSKAQVDNVKNKLRISPFFATRSIHIRRRHSKRQSACFFYTLGFVPPHWRRNGD